MRGCDFDRLSHGMCSRHETQHMPRLRLAPFRAHARFRVAVAELGVVRRRYAHRVQRTLFSSYSQLHAVIIPSRLSFTQREPVAGTSSPFAARSPFVSCLISYRPSPGMTRRFCARVTTTGGSLPVPSERFRRQFAELSCPSASPNHALQRTATLAFSYRCAALTSTGSVTACAPPPSPAHAAPSPRAAVLTRALSGRGR